MTEIISNDGAQVISSMDYRSNAAKIKAQNDSKCYFLGAINTIVFLSYVYLILCFWNIVVLKLIDSASAEEAKASRFRIFFESLGKQLAEKRLIRWIEFHFFFLLIIEQHLFLEITEDQVIYIPS